METLLTAPGWRRVGRSLLFPGRLAAYNTFLRMKQPLKVILLYSNNISLILPCYPSTGTSQLTLSSSVKCPLSGTAFATPRFKIEYSGWVPGEAAATVTTNKHWVESTTIRGRRVSKEFRRGAELLDGLIHLKLRPILCCSTAASECACSRMRPIMWHARMT